ncbi:hypothetical protein [Gordonia sp. (in: high G+C Gram-positive bacteria)]|uniref:hypothetical protein n=1 Tax=Gordonia sp. (in: high G+C Gram-positive bacteria) TaxID=84139 RepID=UPI003F97ADEF
MAVSDESADSLVDSSLEQAVIVAAAATAKVIAVILAAVVFEILMGGLPHRGSPTLAGDLLL